MVSALDYGSRGPGSSPGQVIVLCSWARYFNLTVPLSTQEYKWVPANCQGNLTKILGVTGISSGGLDNFDHEKAFLYVFRVVFAALYS